MYKLSAFADEIGSDVGEQIKVLKDNGVSSIELRSAEGTGVLKLTREQIKEIKKQADDNGIGFSAVGSPLGKYPLDGDFQAHLDDLERALEYASLLEAPYIRMFSFFIPEDKSPEECRTQVVDWLGRMVEKAENTEIVLAHENEKHIYGDTGERCKDLYQSIRSPSFTGIFDFANYVQCGEDPYNDCWQLVKNDITYFHIKDARSADGTVVPAGRGDGKIEEILGEAFESGFDNFLTLEPHLSVAESNYGKTTPDLFATAVNALNDVLKRVH